MFIFKQIDQSCFTQYDSIPMVVYISSYYRLDKINGGLGGINLIKTPLEPFIKDFDDDLANHSYTTDLLNRFDISNWGFFMAFDGEKSIGGAIIATKTDGVNMLCGRNDLAVLWDIRVDEKYKNQGVGQGLFDIAVDWSREQGMKQLKIECQNNNVPAVNFYHKQGAVLSAIDEYAYYNEPKYRHETQFIWMLDI